ncbi:DUF58 domain-containing protein [Actinopolymorpha pittospori]|uniref:Uncharacterized protein (DUF58 family) n=1 Tax=Actinopolymorpha pittospori TaxID=648752 RepID=A0A927RAN5_9ACTN|nr:uncharacterized protein (DUF58 family) [Actinopolymorpha pittospori]
MTLTFRSAMLALAGVVVVAFVVPSRAGILLVTSGVVLFALVDVWLAGPVRPLRFVRKTGGPGGTGAYAGSSGATSATTSVRLGEAVEVRLLVTNPGRRAVRGLLRDAWPPSAGAVTERHPLELPGGERRRITTVLRPTRRGDRQAHRVTVRSLGPMGLAGRQGSHEVPWTVRALPPFDSRKHLPSRLARLRELDGRASVLVRGQGTEFDSLRDYVVGDDVRSVDWRATARRGAVVVRTWRPERDRHVLVVLDTGRTSAGRVGDAPRLDHSMDAALLLAALATRAGDRVDLMAFDRRVRADVRRAAPHDVLPRFTAAMAPLGSELVEADHRGLVSAIAARASQRSLVVLLTGLDAAVIEEGLLPVLAPLVRKHEVCVAAVADPAVEALARGRGDAAAVYAAAAAEQARVERRHVTVLLERLGVTVVDEPPDRIAPALADTYLALKKAGRL